MLKLDFDKIIVMIMIIIIKITITITIIIIVIIIKILPGDKDSKRIVLQVSEFWSWNAASSIRHLKILVAVIVENQVKLLKWKKNKWFTKSSSSWLTG